MSSPSFNQKQYIREYNRIHYVRVSLDVKPELRDKWKAEALKRKESLTQFITRAANARIEAGE